MKSHFTLSTSAAGLNYIRDGTTLSREAKIPLTFGRGFSSISMFQGKKLLEYMDSVCLRVCVSVSVCLFLSVSVCVYYTLLSLVGNSGRLYPGKTTAAARAALSSPTSACWVFSCFRNPPNFDTDYRSITCVVIILLRAYTHGSLAHRQRVSTTFLTRENSLNFSCAPDGTRTSVNMNLSPTL